MAWTKDQAREYNRQWREANRDKAREQSRKYNAIYRERNRVKRNAQVRVNNRVVRRKWPKASFFICTDCNARASEYHHEDYALWWSVLPLCKECHIKRHNSGI